MLNQFLVLCWRVRFCCNSSLPSAESGTTVYTQGIEFSPALTESPPSPQLWGNKNFQSPPNLGDLGGKIGSNADRQDLCVHRSASEEMSKGYISRFCLTIKPNTSQPSCFRTLIVLYNTVANVPSCFRWTIMFC